MDVSHGVKTGGDYCVMMNQHMLKNIYGEENVVVVSVPKIPLWKHMLNLLFLNSYGHTQSVKKQIIKSLNNEISFACVDGAYYGGYAKLLHRFGIKSIIFCHNVEYEFSRHRFLNNKSAFNWLLWKYMSFNEKKTFRYSSYIITLNKRDSDGIARLYGRCADLILPSFFFSKPVELLKSGSPSQPYLIFVGSDFFANNEGIKWFIEEVSNEIDIPVWIAGSCCKYIEKAVRLDKYPNVRLLGFVDDLQSIYINAIGVVGPVFSGSGLKTKTVEAMMYGKYIYATSESFEGIDADYSRIGALCNTKVEFVDALKTCVHEVFNDYTYSVFMKNYSTDSAYVKFSDYVRSVIG